MAALKKYFRMVIPNKKSLLTLLIAFCISFSMANPIIPPPIISELCFLDDGWQLEMVFDEMHGIYNLDDIRLVGLNDTALFNSGILVNIGEAMVITEDNLQSPFFIDSSGDVVKIQQYYNGWEDINYYNISFGDYSGNSDLCITAPFGQESLAFQEFCLPGYYGPEYSYWLVKEKPQTIGSNVYDVQKRASFQGYVFDMNLNPLPNIMLDYCYNDDYYSTVPYLVTDENGHFNTVNMFSKKYNIIFRDDDGNFIDDTIISVECDSNNYFEFIMDSTWVGLNELKSLKEINLYNYPNPFSERTTIVADVNYNQVSSKAIIKIYNQQGELLKILPLGNSLNKMRFETGFELSETQLNNGTYIYTLEVDHKKIASNKMIILR